MGTIQSCKSAIGYLAPMQREGCHSCAHVRDAAKGFYRGPARECGLHGFTVSVMGICDKHEPKGQQGGAA